MTPNEFQGLALANALPSSRNLNYMLLGLCNEAGEVAGKYKKVLRGDVTLPHMHSAIVKELGDVAWYLAGACEMLGVQLEDVMQGNIDKLNDRANRGALQGNGDDR